MAEMQHHNEARSTHRRRGALLPLPIAILSFAAVAGWLLALLRGGDAWWLEAAILALSLLAGGYLAARHLSLRRSVRDGEGGVFAGGHRGASRLLDRLTGLPSRPWLEQTIATELARTRRYHRHLSLLVLDIDDFGRMNRDHGEVAGDWMLESVAALVRRSLRESDHVARIGGDAFGVLLVETPKKGALALAEKMRAAVAALSADPVGKATPGVEVSVSIGVSSARESDTVEELLRRAEDAAMTAHRDGGNRVATVSS